MKKNKLIAFLFVAIAVSLLSSAQGAGIALSIKDLDDESRAGVIRELVKSKSFTTGSTPASKKDADDGEDGEKKKGCNMDIADSKSEPGRPAPRRITVLITGSVVQTCNQ